MQRRWPPAANARACAQALLAIAATVAAEKPYDRKTLRILGPGNYWGDANPIMSKIHELARPVQEELGGNVFVDNVPAEHFAEEALLDLESSGVYDAYYGLATQTGQLRGTGRLLDLSPYLQKYEGSHGIGWMGINLIFRTVSRSFDASLVSLPWGGNELHMHIRADVFARHGLRFPTNIDELVAAVAAINGTDMNGDGVGDYGWCHCSSNVRGEVNLAEVFIAPLLQMDAQRGVWFDTETMRPKVRSAGVRVALEAYRKLQHYAPPFGEWQSCGAEDDFFFVRRNCGVVMTFQYVLEAHRSPSARWSDVGVGRTPGTRVVQSPTDVDEVIPCSEALCKHAVRMPDGQLTNYAGTSGGGWGIVVSKRALERGIADFAFLVGSQITSLKNMNRTLMFDPIRSDLYNATLPLYTTHYRHVEKTWLAEYLQNISYVATDENMHLKLRIPGSERYYKVIDEAMQAYQRPGSTLATTALLQRIYDDFEEITEQLGREGVRDFYRISLGLPAMTPEEGGGPFLAVPLLASAVVVFVVVVILVGSLAYYHLQLRKKTRSTKFAPTRGQAVLVFTDVQASTVLWQEAPEGMKNGIATHHQIIRRLISTYNAYEVKTIGDSFMIACGDADRAVLLMNDIHTALNAAKWPQSLLAVDDAAPVRDPATGLLIYHGPRVRIGAAIGSAEAAWDPIAKGYDYYGDLPNTASRVEGVTYGGQTLITRDLFVQISPSVLAGCTVVDVGKTKLKGIREHVSLMQILPKGLSLRQFAAPPIFSSSRSFSMTDMQRSPTAEKAPPNMTVDELVREVSQLRARLSLSGSVSCASSAAPTVRNPLVVPGGGDGPPTIAVPVSAGAAADPLMLTGSTHKDDVTDASTSTAAAVCTSAPQHQLTVMSLLSPTPSASLRATGTTTPTAVDDPAPLHTPASADDPGPVPTVPPAARQP